MPSSREALLTVQQRKLLLRSPVKVIKTRAIVRHFLFVFPHSFTFPVPCDLPYDLQVELQAASLTTHNWGVVEQMYCNPKRKTD